MKVKYFEDTDTLYIEFLAAWPHCSAELCFDGAAKTVGAVEMLTLQMRADGVGFIRVDFIHDESAIAGQALLYVHGKFAIDGVRTDQRIVLAKRVVSVA